MDSGSIIIGIVVLAIIFFPFMIMGMKKSKKQKGIKNTLQQIATENGCKITQSELFGNFGIGVDEAAGMMFFHHQLLSEANSKAVKLHEVKTCSIHRSSSSKNTGKEVVHADEKLGLLFTFREPKRSTVFFEMYNADQSLRLAGELQVAQRWLETINKLLKQPAAQRSTPFPPAGISAQLSAV